VSETILLNEQELCQRVFVATI